MIRRRPSTVLQAWLLAALLLAAQALGLAHRVGHAPGLGKAVVVSALGWSADHKAGSGDCRLVDQLAHADALCGPPFSAVLAATQHAVPGAVAIADAPLAPHRAPFARGPPQA